VSAAQVTVILSGMFDPRELESQLGAAQELEEEVQAECTKLGPIEKVGRRAEADAAAET
jgi:predicted aldo/keto reductase-like oxidoreductase